MLILSVPYRDKNSILESIPLGCSLIEYRLDFARNLKNFEFSRFGEKDIITLRLRSEGGKAVFSPEFKKDVIRKTLTETKALIDCEYKFLLKSNIKIPHDRLILSLHTTSMDKKNIFSFFNSSIKAKYYKLAIKSSEPEDINAISAIIPPEIKDKLIMIPLPPISLSMRLLYKLYGSIATYVYYKEKTASNQLSLSLARICRIDEIKADTSLYAIAGNVQVMTSLSVYIHNYCFSKSGVNSIMLPVVAKSASEVLMILNWIKSRATLKGVAITMPFKTLLPGLITGKQFVANSWKPQTGEFANTDEAAMNKALDNLKLTLNSSIAILGTGAMSLTAQKVISERGYGSYRIINRGDIRNSNGVQTSYRNVDLLRKYDLLINCTPFGLNKKDKPEYLPDFNSLIDLPYGTNPTTLVQKAKDYNLPFISGTTFWKWQAMEQAEFFGMKLELGNLLI